MMTKNSRPYGSERGVSPVVGVMLMLVVVIIIAAIVSGFSGNLMSGSSAKKAPTLSMDVKVVNTGYWQGSGFYATVTGVSEPIPTKDL
ncbi:type IV pilin, partial [Methanoregula sp.]|uniref:type IV pilin n=1 Tax=Methanoregula sp. TaxID=2052170 RepID=UPI002370803E